METNLTNCAVPGGLESLASDGRRGSGRDVQAPEKSGRAAQVDHDPSLPIRASSFVAHSIYSGPGADPGAKRCRNP